MSKIEINQLPVPTWTWLKVNEKSIEVPERIVPVEIVRRLCLLKLPRGLLQILLLQASMEWSLAPDRTSRIMWSMPISLLYPIV